MVRAKFKCDSVTKTVNWSGNKDEHPFLYDVKMSPVVNGSEENKNFFKWTPSGEVKLSTMKEDHFIPGKEYYLDFTEAE